MARFNPEGPYYTTIDAYRAIHRGTHPGFPMKTFVYKDNTNSKKGGECPIVFKCEAPTIMEADELFKAAIGKDPAKMNHIGCSFSET